MKTSGWIPLDKELKKSLPRDRPFTELEAMFLKTYKKWGKKIPELGPEAQAVIMDMQSDLNVPFVLKWNPDSKDFELINKTVMRKKNFMTSGRKLRV